MLNDNHFIATSTQNLDPKVIVQRRYETALIDALNNQTNIPNYFDDARIEQYFLDQITEFEKSGKLGGADDMRSILNSTLSLHTKLHALATIGKEKSNNAFLSLSRMGRRKEVREFYKNLRVFEDLASPDEVHKTFENFLRNSKKVSSKIENIEHHIQRYTLLRLGLQGIQLTPKDKASLARFLNRYCTKSLSDRPLKVLNEIEWTQKFLNLEKPAIQNAIASPKNTGNYTQPFSQWIQFAIATQTSPTLEDLLLIGVRPTTEQLVECCKLVHNAQEKLDDEAASIFIRALAKTTLSAEKETKTQLVQALSQALRNHQPGAQAVLNEMFYQAALHNDSKILVDLTNAISRPLQTGRQGFDSFFDDEEMQKYLLDQIGSLRRIIPGTAKHFGGISVPTALGYKPEISSAPAMKEIINSDLQLSQKLQILAAIARGKIQKESGRLVRRHTSETSYFYDNLQRCFSQTTKETFSADFFNFVISNEYTILDSSLPLGLKLLFIIPIAKKICQKDGFDRYSDETKNFSLGLTAFVGEEDILFLNKNIKSAIKRLFLDLLKNQQLIPREINNLDSYLKRYMLIQQSLRLIPLEKFENESLQNEFEKWMDDNVFEDPSTIFDEIKGFQQFLDKNKTAINSAIANNTNSEKFQEFFMSWVNFFFTTRGDLSFEDLNYIGASPTKKDFIICTKLILARNDTELRIKDIFPQLINPYFKQLLSKEKNFYDQLKFLLEFCLETKQPIDLTLMTTYPDKTMPQSDKPQEIVSYMKNILSNPDVIEGFKQYSENQQKTLIISLSEYLYKTKDKQQNASDKGHILQIINNHWQNIAKAAINNKTPDHEKAVLSDSSDSTTSLKTKEHTTELTEIFDVLSKIPYYSSTLFSQYPEGIKQILMVKSSLNYPSDTEKLTQIKNIIEARKNIFSFSRSDTTKTIYQAFDKFFSNNTNQMIQPNSESFRNLINDLKKISPNAKQQSENQKNKEASLTTLTT